MAKTIAQPRVGDLLLSRGLITDDELQQALSEQQASGKRLGDILVAQERITERDLVDVLSERLGIPKISVKGITADPEVTKIIPLRIARKHRVCALFKIGNRLTVAMADPLDMVAIDEIRYQTNLQINRVISPAADIEAAIAQYYSVADNVERVISDSAAQAEAQGATSADDAPVVRLVDVLLAEAIKQKASDMHVEPSGNSLRVRFRVDGVLREEAQPPANLQAAIVSRIKVMSGMDVSEKRIPQDGRFTTGPDGNPVDMRVSTIPTIHGEKVVVRLLGRRDIDLSLDKIGLSEAQKEMFRQELLTNEGMVLISGPTSSGKTTTLYSALREIATPEKNVVTVEDPVENELAHVSQVQVNEKAGLTFPICLRAFLRQNPDIIMVGEVRDAATAHIAVRAAMTGHLVLSTIHTIDAAAVPHRLIDMGVESFLVATGLRAVVAQRLVRRLCTECASDIEPSQAIREQLGFDALANAGNWKKANGCRQCRGTGYRGRVGLFELFVVDDTIRGMISEGESTTQLRQYLHSAGFSDLRLQARALVARGITTAEETLRVIPRRSEVWESIAEV